MLVLQDRQSLATVGEQYGTAVNAVTDTLNVTALIRIPAFPRLWNAAAGCTRLQGAIRIPMNGAVSHGDITSSSDGPEEYTPTACYDVT